VDTGIVANALAPFTLFGFEILFLFPSFPSLFTKPLQIDGYAEEMRGVRYGLTGTQVETASVIPIPKNFVVYTVSYMGASVATCAKVFQGWQMRFDTKSGAFTSGPVLDPVQTESTPGFTACEGISLDSSRFFPKTLSNDITLYISSLCTVSVLEFLLVM
jgi:hypothetical protein